MNPALIALIGAVGGILAAAIPVYITNRRHPSRRVTDGSSIVEAAEGVVGILSKELKRLSERVDKLEEDLHAEEQHTDALASEVDQLRRDNSLLLRGVNLLIAQLRRLGHEPDWKPGTDDITGTPT